MQVIQMNSDYFKRKKMEKKCYQELTKPKNAGPQALETRRESKQSRSPRIRGHNKYLLTRIIRPEHPDTARIMPLYYQR